MDVDRQSWVCWLAGWVLLAWGGFATAGDWPQWRGPTADGHAATEDLTEEWPSDGPPVLWNRTLGQGYSAFAVANGRAYTQAQSLYEQSLVCLDAATGVTLWSQRYNWPYDGGGLYPGPRATPAIAGGRVYFADPSGAIGCVDAQTGQRYWSVNPKAQFRGRGTDFGVSASPVVWRDRVIVPTGGRDASLVALDAQTGAVVWRCGDLPASYATPLVVPFAERWIVIAPLENSLLCADAETGRRLWELDLSQGYDEHSAAPLYREPYLFLSGPFRSGGRCWKLVPEGEPPGCRLEPVWESQKMSNDIASCVLIDDALYGFDLKDIQSRLHRPSRGEFRCLDWATGAVRWSSADPGHAHVIAVRDRLLIFNDRGELLLARVTRDGYQELGRTAVFPDEICWTHPALSEGRVFLRTQTRAACLYVGASAPSTSQPLSTVAEIPRSNRIDPTVWLGGEREFPAATPETADFLLWYVWTTVGLALCWGIMLIATWLFRCWSSPRRVAATHDTDVLVGYSVSGFSLLVILCGALGSWVWNAGLPDYLFSWPLALWGLAFLALETSLRAIRQPENAWAPWRARGTIGLLTLGCGIYFHLCRQLGLATEWAFLVGFPCTVPISLAADRWLPLTGPAAIGWLLPVGVVSYTAYYWGSVGFLQWWCRIGT